MATELPPVLLADPDQDVLRSTSLLVATLGYRAVAVGRGDEVLDAIERERPGLVLLETQFPGLNVAGLVAAMRTHPEFAGTPIVLWSAARDLAAQATRHQADGTLAKPFEARQLQLLLRRHLGMSQRLSQEERDRALARQVRDAFRELRNLVAALDNYVAVLARAPELAEPSRAAVHDLTDVALRLEAKAERVRAFVLDLVEGGDLR
jgi:CheY-like chemotaxis protein